MVICEICSKEYRVVGYWHLRTHSISLLEYKARYPNANTVSTETRKIHAIAMTGINNPMYGRHRFGADSPMFGRCGNKHPNYGKHHSQEVRDKISQATKGRLSWNKGLTKDTDNRVAKQAETQTGHIRSASHCKNISLAKKGRIIMPDERLRISKGMKRLFKEPSFCKRWGRIHAMKPNKLETALYNNILNTHFHNEWKYTGDFTFIINGYNPDFININGHKICIEVYHPYWKIKHWESVERYKRIRRYRYKKMAWRVIFLSASDVYNRTEYCVRKINRAYMP